MFRNKLVFSLSFFLFTVPLCAYAQSDLYTFPKIEEEIKVKKSNLSKPSDILKHTEKKLKKIKKKNKVSPPTAGISERISKEDPPKE